MLGDRAQLRYSYQAPSTPTSSCDEAVAVEVADVGAVDLTLAPEVVAAGDTDSGLPRKRPLRETVKDASGLKVIGGAIMNRCD